jgi:Putative Actinobacterial Holin-X, holin superfamily III
MADRYNNEVRTVPVPNGGVGNEWPTLLGRMVDDLSRIVQTEFRLFEANLAGLLSSTVDRAISGMLMVAASVAGGACLLVALILLLHHWLEWWQAVGVVGLVMVLLALIAYFRMSAPRAPVVK